MANGNNDQIYFFPNHDEAEKRNLQNWCHFSITFKRNGISSKFMWFLSIFFRCIFFIRNGLSMLKKEWKRFGEGRLWLYSGRMKPILLVRYKLQIIISNYMRTLNKQNTANELLLLPFFHSLRGLFPSFYSLRLYSTPSTCN